MSACHFSGPLKASLVNSSRPRGRGTDLASVCSLLLSFTVPRLGHCSTIALSVVVSCWGFPALSLSVLPRQLHRCSLDAWGGGGGGGVI